VAIYTYH